MNEDKYVLKHEWEKAKGKIHERINEVDNKHTDITTRKSIWVAS